MTESPSPALRARESLAAAGGGSLHIQGIGCLDDPNAELLLYDDGGRPTFLCPPDSPVTRAARERRAALLSVVPRDGECVETTVLLGGHLCAIGNERIDGGEVAVIGLQIYSVFLEINDPSAAAVVQHEVPLGDYLAAQPDTMDAAAERILRHTNDSHAPELREFTAAIRGISVGDIASAALSDLDLDGVALRWIDCHGTHTARIVFSTPADGPQALAARLRETLTNSHR